MTIHRGPRLNKNQGTIFTWVAILCSIFAVAHGSADPVLASISFAEDLEADSRWAGEHNLAILVVVTREDCQHCALLKRDVLVPMLRSGDYDDKILIRELMTEPRHSVADFHGKRSNSGRIAARFGVKLTPTVLLLDATGKSLHPAIVGINSTDFYGHYLDEAIETALGQINKNSTGLPAQGN